jgi:hypothetical protein
MKSTCTFSGIEHEEPDAPDASLTNTMESSVATTIGEAFAKQLLAPVAIDILGVLPTIHTP